MNHKETIYICMGSACHQFGVYHLLPILQRLLTDHALDHSVMLKGAFCVGPCINGIVLKVGDQMIMHINTQNIEQKFQDEILPYLQPKIS